MRIIESVVGSILAWFGIANVKHHGAIGDGTTDDTAAIQRAIAAGRIIYFPAGTYLVSTAGTVTGDAVTNPYALVVRQTDGTRIFLGAGRNAATIKLATNATANTAIILARGTSAAYRLNPTLIIGLELDGNGANQGSGTWDDFGLITAVYAKYVMLVHLHLHDAKMFAFHPLRDSQHFGVFFCRQSTGSAGTAISQSFIEIPRAYVAFNSFEGLNSSLLAVLTLACNSDVTIPGEWNICVCNIFTGGGTQLGAAGIRHSIIALNLFSDVVNSNGTSLKTEGWNHTVTDYDFMENLVFGNIFYNVREGIKCDAFDATYGCKRNLYIGNIISDGSGENLTFGIRETGTAAGHSANYFYLNRVIGASITPFALLATTSQARFNAGYVTENSGTAATAAATTVVVNHGLATTPTRVIVTPQGDPGGRWWVSTKTSTQFTINLEVSGTITFDWKAQVGEG